MTRDEVDAMAAWLPTEPPTGPFFGLDRSPQPFRPHVRAPFFRRLRSAWNLFRTELRYG